MELSAVSKSLQYGFGGSYPGRLNTDPVEAREKGPQFRNWTRTTLPNKEILEQSVLLFLQGIGEDIHRDDLKETPRRVAEMWMETLNGYDTDPQDYVTTFPSGGYHGPVVLKNAELYSTCAHHLQPFIGEISIAYQPSGQIVGLSKLLRIARVFAKRLQTQEVMTQEIADTLWHLLSPDWVVVRYEAEHYCMRMRGTRIKDSSTITMAGYGAYPKNIFSI